MAGPRAVIKPAAPCGALQARSPGACVLQLSGAGGLQGRDVIQLRDGGHALGGDHAAALQLPVLVLLQQHRPHQTGDRVVIGEDPDHAGTAFDFLVDALQQVGAPDLFPVLLGEVAERQHALPGLLQWPPADFVYSAAALGKRSAREEARSSQRDSISSAVSWANTLRRAAVTMPW